MFVLNFPETDLGYFGFTIVHCFRWKQPEHSKCQCNTPGMRSTSPNSVKAWLLAPKKSGLSLVLCDRLNSSRKSRSRKLHQLFEWSRHVTPEFSQKVSRRNAMFREIKRTYLRNFTNEFSDKFGGVPILWQIICWKSWASETQGSAASQKVATPLSQSPWKKFSRLYLLTCISQDIKLKRMLLNMCLKLQTYWECIECIPKNKNSSHIV